MTRNKHGSPTLTLALTEEQRQTAIQSNSGGCLVADAIKKQYPHLTGITVDMATIRVSDRTEGVRFTYLTPAAAQHAILAFDQGWPLSTDHVVLRRAVKITPIRRHNASVKRRHATRNARLAELEAKERSTEPLTRREKASLIRMRHTDSKGGLADPNPLRPESAGPAEVKLFSNGTDVVIEGGVDLMQGPAHPNLLRGRNRHFGAKLADPGQVFQEAVDAAVSQRLAEQDEPSALIGAPSPVVGHVSKRMRP